MERLLLRRSPSGGGLQWSNTADLFAACCAPSWTISLQRYSTGGDKEMAEGTEGADKQGADVAREDGKPAR